VFRSANKFMFCQDDYVGVSSSVKTRINFTLLRNNVTWFFVNEVLDIFNHLIG